MIPRKKVTRLRKPLSELLISTQSTHDVVRTLIRCQNAETQTVQTFCADCEMTSLDKYFRKVPPFRSESLSSLNIYEQELEINYFKVFSKITTFLLSARDI